MLTLHAKRGVESTLERVFQSSGHKIEELMFLWTGNTAGVSREGGKVVILMPSIDETADINRDVYNQYIGYVLHELGHLWFTTDKPWNDARTEHGDWLGHLINGLEDPRIEQKVVDSGYAPNAFALFERLLNAVIERDGQVKPDDFKNIPFMLAIEGRRLNGYCIDHPYLMDGNPWRHLLEPALQKAHKASSTYEIASIAVDLFNALKSEALSNPPKQPTKGNKDSGKGKTRDGNQNASEDASNRAECLDGDMSGVRDVEPNINGIVPKVSNREITRPGICKPVFETFTFG